MRKVMLLATIGETITETTDSSGTKGFIVQRTAAGLKGPCDTFDGTGKEVVIDRPGWSFSSSNTRDKEKEDIPKGRVRSWSWWMDVSSPCSDTYGHPGTGEPMDGYLLQDWILEGVDWRNQARTTNFVASGEKDGVRDWMVWGFCRINGERYRAARYYARKGEREVRARMVYAWRGRS